MDDIEEYEDSEGEGFPEEDIDFFVGNIDRVRGFMDKQIEKFTPQELQQMFIEALRRLNK